MTSRTSQVRGITIKSVSMLEISASGSLVPSVLQLVRLLPALPNSGAALFGQPSFGSPRTFMDTPSDNASIKVGQAMRAAGVSRMKSRKRLLILVPLVGVACAIAIWFALAFMGVLDSGKFEIVQSQPISPDRIAMLSRRSDNTALSGDTYFVVIGDICIQQGAKESIL